MQDLYPEAPVSWTGGHRAKIDVTCGSRAIDVKHAVLEPRKLDGETQNCIEYMGANRSPQVRDGVTHYALVVTEGRLDVDFGTDLRLTVTADRLRFRVYLVPAEVINDPSVFRKTISSRGKNKGNPSTRLSETAKATDLEPWLIADTLNAS